MISPYALLTASRPKSAASIVTPYDLYSAVQNRENMPSPPPESPASPAPVRIPVSYTHLKSRPPVCTSSRWQSRIESVFSPASLFMAMTRVNALSPESGFSSFCA